MLATSGRVFSGLIQCILRTQGKHVCCHIFSCSSLPVYDLAKILTTGAGIHHYAHLALITHTWTSLPSSFPPLYVSLPYVFSPVGTVLVYRRVALWHCLVTGFVVLLNVSSAPNSHLPYYRIPIQTMEAAGNLSDVRRTRVTSTPTP